MSGVHDDYRSACPSRAELQAFHDGLLDDAQCTAIAVHVSTCASCDTVLQRLAGTQAPGAQRVTGGRLGNELPGEPAWPPPQVAGRSRGASQVPLVAGVAQDSNSLASTETPQAGGRSPPGAPVRSEAGRARHGSTLPEKIGPFFVLRRLGGGGFGEVFLCKDSAANRLLAIKVPKSGQPVTEERIKSFLNEARLVAELQQPGIVQVRDFLRLEEYGCAVIMEYIDGGSLSELLKREPLSPERAAAIVADLAMTLDDAHRRGIFHRDIKPANILLDSQGRAYLSDFGLALLDDQRWEHPTAIEGTYVYMSPEQIRAKTHVIDSRTDIFSLGVALYEMLTRQRPFAGRTLQQISEEIQHKPANPRLVKPELPVELERICVKCLEKDPNRRFTTARDLAAELRQWLESRPAVRAATPPAAGLQGEPGQPPGLSATSRRVRPLRRRFWWICGMLAAVLFLAAGVLVRSWTRSSCPPVDRVAKLGIPYPVLAWRPQKLMPPPRASEPNLEYDDAQQDLVLRDIQDFYLVRLSETAAQNFRLRINLSKEDAGDGGCGMFWGFHTAARPTGEPFASCFAVMLYYDRDQDAFHLRGFQLAFDKLHADTPDVSTLTLWDQKVAPSTLPGRSDIVSGLRSVHCQLDASVTDGSLVRVECAGLPLPRETLRAAPPLAGVQQAAGEFGVFNRSGTTTFHARDTTFTLLRGADQ